MRYLFVSRNVLVLFLFVSMEQTPLFVIFFFFGSVRSFHICTAVFIKIFVIVYSNIFFLYCSKTNFFFWSFLSYIVIQNFVLFIFCLVCFCSTNIELQVFVLFDITKCLFKIFFVSLL